MIRAQRNFSEIATMKAAYEKDGRRLKPGDLSILENASIVFDDKTILWVGPDADFPREYARADVCDGRGRVLLPEIVDCHTHLVFAGDRGSEHALRLSGKSYAQITRGGGGILSTVRATRALPRGELVLAARRRIERLRSYGVGTIEIKSGYGLSVESERELSLAIDELKRAYAPEVRIFNTFMAAHAVPAEFKGPAAYMNEVVLPLLKELAADGVIDAVDIFHERGYFRTQNVRRLFDEAGSLGIARKLHADEFSDSGGAALATESGALSADHLLKTGATGIRCLAGSKTAAVLLPGTGFFLGLGQADARAFLDAGAKVALASDFNPGSCMMDNLPLLAAMAAPALGMNPAEVLSSITLNAAAALGLTDQGALVPGLKPRFAVFNTPKVHDILYHWGRNFHEFELPPSGG